MLEMPLLRVELEYPKMSLLTAINERLLEQEELVRQALDMALTPEYLAATLEKQIRKVLDEVVRQEVERYYQTGDGRKLVRAAVEGRIAEMYP